MKNTKKGFTLIELLVVVLIIGILAAIALPQYKKSVDKARITEWISYVNSFYKGINLWLLKNGDFPSHDTRFSGDGSNSDGYNAASLEIDVPCIQNVGNWCRTKFGQFHVACGTSQCYADLSTNYDGYSGWLPKSAQNVIWTSMYENGQIVLEKTPSDTHYRKLICRYWKESFGDYALTNSAESECSEVGV